MPKILLSKQYTENVIYFFHPKKGYVEPKVVIELLYLHKFRLTCISMIRIVRLILSLIITSWGWSQIIELPNELRNKPYNEVHQYLDKEISKNQDWNKRKIELVLHKSFWYTKNWEYDMAKELFKTVPIDVTVDDDLLAKYFISEPMVQHCLCL